MTKRNFSKNINFFGHIVASRSLLVKQQQKRHCLSAASLPFQVELRKFVIAKIRPRVSLCNVSLRSKKCCVYNINDYKIIHVCGNKDDLFTTCKDKMLKVIKEKTGYEFTEEELKNPDFDSIREYSYNI